MIFGRVLLSLRALGGYRLRRARRVEASSTRSLPAGLIEILLVGRALSATEVAALASGARAGVGRFGSACGGLTIGTANGAPSIGNQTFAVTIDSPGVASFAINFGVSRCASGPLNLPFDLGSLSATLAGCHLAASSELGSFSGSKGPGPAQIVVGIPSTPSLSGLTLYLQAPAIDGSTGAFAMTSALALGIGQ